MTVALKRYWIPSVEQSNLLSAVATGQQPEVVRRYADAIRCEGRFPKQIDFRAVNRAIRARWPRSLERIKTMAWKLVEGTP